VYDFVMGVSQRKRVRGSAAVSPRIARRRERMRESLLAAAKRQFAARGVDPVSVEDLLAEADVSRATFYGLFSSKYKLLEDILDPIFERATANVRALASEPAGAAVDGIVAIYLELWAAHREGLELIPLIDRAAFRHFEAQHRALQGALLEVLAKAERAELLRNGSAQYSLKVIARTAVPLLRVYDGHPAADALFRDALRGLLLRAH
jgi:AcrR family transcriptional regulator